MDNFKVIYRILKLLEESMDHEEFDRSALNAEYFGVSEARFNAILRMLKEDGYIDGITYVNGLPGVKILRYPRITLKGLEYLEENSTMKKAAALLRGIKETVPGL